MARKRERERGLHRIVQTLDEDLSEEDAARVIGIAAGIKSSTTTTDGFDLLSLEADPESDMQPLLRQLRDHLTSMRNNTASLQPVMAAMDDARTALDEFAATRLNDRARGRLFGVME